MMKSLLIANRGEIACRIIRTARRLGIETVAVYSAADAGALHVRSADRAVAIGAAPASESYLVGERILAAARDTGAAAIHPGYGFLSENADFAQSVIDAGLIWVGPRPASIRAMGLKDAAKARMIAAGVPVTPGYLGDDQSADRLLAEASAIGWPVLIKAVAGGGGKGMRRVDSADAFVNALASCRREATASFGDDRVLIEKYIPSPRHIEVQVFGDTHGNVVHLFERDCSLQRRHQKVIEEAPAPGMDAATRAAVCDAAVRAARAVDYVGAGTIEFIADGSQGLSADRIWFMEMNTRLQVEHPVTEAITGQDLVEWQLRVAAGEPLPCRQEDLAIDGWAMEARLYAEDPATGFLPSTGPLTRLRLPADIRIDTGVEQGDVVTPFYDPMIAKLIVHASTREAAAEALSAACAQVEVAPVRTNAGFLARCARADAFRAGTATTGFIAAAGDDLLRTTDDAPAMAALGWRLEEMMEPDASPWAPSPDALFGFRLNHAPMPARIAFRQNGTARVADVRPDGAGWSIALDGQAPVMRGETLPTTHGLLPAAPWTGPIQIFADGDLHIVDFPNRPELAGGTTVNGTIRAPMPGRIVSIDVAEGDTVTKGQTLLVLEAMKMEQALIAPFDGIVATLTAEQGGQVVEGAMLAEVTRDA
ncbi:methylcrotonoyl-CoA carboxylase [Sphingomonas sp. Leaf339]|uniref:acetyl/propionyl/methylcrotonyl-CoA carboxylase subunit alpha n=1 Tax=Sphingomonas sp. Leaf339 TaxID=1736343 RepID=UPI0006F55986|nr:biotin carboxylase N-terminal domain-containing protein [Sphingomonas sp. Leaf339]KQU53101.1 methylcrotonoyl-CoA carboxylase [Sphingomonas sp. Leaf339]